MSLRLSGFIPMLGLFLWLPLQAAEDTLHYDQVNLTAEASQETDNDTLVAVLTAQQEGSDPALLGDSVNRLIADAVEQAKKVPGIKIQTLGYQTSPRYQQQRLIGWRVKQSLRLQSMDGEKLSQLISHLQSKLALESISYSVSDERRRSTEEALISKAIEAFQQRAKLVTERLGRKNYRLVEMQIHTSSQQVRPMQMRASMMRLDEAGASPSLEAGTQTLRVEINGRIELQLE